METKKKMLRIFLCGAHSTGKTTLLNDVAEAMDIRPIPEVARQVVRDMGLNRDQFDPKYHPETFERLQVAILERQCEVEQENVTAYIADRGIDPIVYAAMYLDIAAKERILTTEAAKQCIARYKESIMCVIHPHKECINDDGFRMVPKLDELREYTETLRNVLVEMKIPFHDIDVLDRQERVKCVLNLVTESKKGLILVEK